MIAFVASDIHGYFDEFTKALMEAGFDKNNPEHIFISCGDLLDRGPKAKECLEFVNSLPDDRKILIMGNHEDCMIDLLLRGYAKSHDYHNMTQDTVLQIAGKDKPFEEAVEIVKKDPGWNKYLDSCKDFYEAKDYIFVHGWIPTGFRTVDDERFKDVPDLYKPTESCYDPNWRNGNNIDWYNARWENGMKMWANGIKEPGKTIVCGHYHVSWGHAYLHNDGVEWLEPVETYYIDPDTGRQEPHVNYEPFIDDGIIAIDACTALSGKVNVFKIENFEK